MASGDGIGVAALAARQHSRGRSLSQKTAIGLSSPRVLSKADVDPTIEAG
jgi:hypothetical protein